MTETDDTAYLKALLYHYEAEIMGEAYFFAMADCFDDAAEREKLTLLAAVERHAADTVRPLIDKYGLVPREETMLKTIGEEFTEPHRHFSWRQLMTQIRDEYPAYLDNFHALEEMAPADDLTRLQRLTLHENVLIDFAQREMANDPDSVMPLRRYVA